MNPLKIKHNINYQGENQETIKRVFYLMERQENLTSWEYDFIDSMVDRLITMEEATETPSEMLSDSMVFTEKMIEVIDEIYEKLEGN